MVAEIDRARPSIWPFVQAVDQYERNLAEGYPDVLRKYEAALQELAPEPGANQKVDPGASIESEIEGRQGSAGSSEPGDDAELESASAER